MIKRTLTGAGVLVFVYSWLFFSHIPSVLHIGIFLIGGLATYEVIRISKIGKPKIYYAVMAVPILILVLPIPAYEYFMMIILPFASIMFAFMMIRKDKISEFNAKISVAVAIAVTALFKSATDLRAFDNGFYYLTFAVTACFINDVAALLVGRSLGKRKLCPKISPKKTVEGAIGGIVCTVIISVISALIFQKRGELRFDMIMLLIWAVLVSIVGQFGDLSMSIVKRIAGVKDFGKLLPGHGGVLDRFDSQMFAVAFTLVFCALGGEFIL